MLLLTIPREKTVQLKDSEADERRRKEASILTQDYEHL
jgi:hypothetical protein